MGLRLLRASPLGLALLSFVLLTGSSPKTHADEEIGYVLFAVDEIGEVFPVSLIETPP